MPITLTVTTAQDSGRGSLRSAIEVANGIGGDVRIAFRIDSGAPTIRPATPLPPLAFSGILDGWSQPGPEDGPRVEISGEASPSGVGLEIVRGGLTVRGLAVTGWPEDGILVHDCQDVDLVDVHAGVGLDGVTAAGNGGCGIRVLGAQRCTIGTPTAPVVLSGNAGYGIWAAHGASHLVLEGSFVGCDRSARTAVPNGRSGVKVEEAYGARLGGLADGAGNVISGNGLYGVEIGGPASRGAVVTGNRIGTDADGVAAVGNGRSGVLVYNTPRVRIGGPAPGEGNVISGNARGGLSIDGAALDGYDYTGQGHANATVVHGNLIGVDRTGERRLGNGLRGVLVNYAQHNTIVDNVIAANGQDGVLILGPDDDSDPNLVPARNRILSNLIGVTRSGAPCGNGRHGVFVRHGSRNEIGGAGDDEGNVISGNTGRGVLFSGLGARTNVLSPQNDLTGNGQGAFHQPRE